MTPGYDALTSGAALLDLSTRGRLRVTGEDRARLLHALTTNHIQQMKPGDGLYAFFLNAQGRILADAAIFCFDDHFLLDTEPSTRQSLFEHIDRYIIADDAIIEDVTDQTFCLSLEGPRSADIGIAAPHHRFAHAPWSDFTAASCATTGPHGIRIFGAADRKDEATLLLENAGALAASSADAELVRLENFVPRYGCDITDHNIPQETQQVHALHFQKGCYLGQEIVERVRSRGHVNKLLMGFRLDAATAPEPGAKLLVEGQPSGEVTSAALITGVAFGLAYVRVPGAKSGAMASIDGHAVELFAPAS